MQRERTTDERLYDLAQQVFDLLRGLECLDADEAIDALHLFGIDTEQRMSISERHGQVITASDGKDRIWITFKNSAIKLFGESFAGEDDFEIKRRP